MVFRLGRMSAKKHVADIMDRGDGDTRVAQQLIGIPARSAPERIEDNLQS
jgi:hypothetical protein